MTCISMLIARFYVSLYIVGLEVNIVISLLDDYHKS
jgi:hypothetical protein